MYDETKFLLWKSAMFLRTELNDDLQVGNLEYDYYDTWQYIWIECRILDSYVDGHKRF